MGVNIIRMKKVLITISLLFEVAFALLLVSCANFLNGNQTVEQLKQKISYENAPSYKIQISSSCGKISPEGLKEYKVTDSVPLIFSEADEYKFIEWRVKDKNTGKDLTNEKYIKIDRLYSEETSFSFDQAPGDNIQLLIEPVCIGRPRIVSTTPTYDSDGVFRDRRITVMFDRQLDENTIYYSIDERNEIKNQNEGNVINWLCTDENEYIDVYSSAETRKFYGYKTGNDDNSIVYKCMTITKLNDKSVNLLKHYGVPEFDEGNTSILRLSAKKYVDGNDQLPPAATNILVNVTKNIGVSAKTSSGKTVVASTYFNNPWNYFTNSQYDNIPPEFVGDITVLNEKDGIALPLAVDEKLAKTEVKCKKPSELVRVTDKLWVSGSIYDGGSGPKSLKATIKKLDNNYYITSDDEKNHEWLETVNLGIIGSAGEIKTNGTAGYEIDLTKLITNEYSGVFALTFTAADKNEQECSSKTYYFIWDNCKAKPIKQFFIGVRDKGLKVLVDFTDALGCEKIVIDINGTKQTFDRNDAYYSVYNFNGLTNETEYEVRVKALNTWGNESDEISLKETPGVRLGLICYALKDKEIICSDNIYKNGVTPIGVVIDINDKTKVRVWDVKDDSKERMFFPKKAITSGTIFNSFTDYDGLSNYNSIINFNDWESGEQVYPYLKTLNKNSAVTWYLPAIMEMLVVYKMNDNKITGAYKKLNEELKIDSVYLHTSGENMWQYVSKVEKVKAGLSYTYLPYVYRLGTEEYKSTGTVSSYYNHYMCQVDLSELTE